MLIQYAKRWHEITYPNCLVNPKVYLNTKTKGGWNSRLSLCSLKAQKSLSGLKSSFLRMTTIQECMSSYNK